jgi:hypothetical protein
MSLPPVSHFHSGADVRFLIRMSLTGAPCKSAGDAPPELSTAEGDKGIVGERRAIRTVRGSNAEKRLEKLAHDTLGQVARDEYQPRSMIVIGPAIEARGRVENVLHAVHNDRCVRHFRQLYDPLQAQEICSMRRAQQLQKHFERTGGDRVVGRQDERTDVVIVPIDVVMVMMVRMGMSLGGKPLSDVRNFFVRIVKPASEKSIWHRLALG